MIVNIYHAPEDVVDAMKGDPDHRGRLATWWSLVRGGDPNPNQSSVLFARGAFVIFFGAALAVPSAAMLMLWASLFWAVPLILALLFAAVIGRAVYLSSDTRKIHRKFDADAHNSDPVTVELNDSEFRFTAPRYQFVIEWPAMKKFWENSTVFVLSDDEPTSYVLPKRCFESESAMQTFRSVVRSHIRQSHSDS